MNAVATAVAAPLYLSRNSSAVVKISPFIPALYRNLDRATWGLSRAPTRPAGAGLCRKPHGPRPRQTNAHRGRAGDRRLGLRGTLPACALLLSVIQLPRCNRRTGV